MNDKHLIQEDFLEEMMPELSLHIHRHYPNKGGAGQRSWAGTMLQ